MTGHKTHCPRSCAVRLVVLLALGAALWTHGANGSASASSARPMATSIRLTAAEHVELRNKSVCPSLAMARSKASYFPTMQLRLASGIDNVKMGLATGQGHR